MKALLYKELKLALHPICIVFVLLFPLLTLVPSYPLAMGFIYVLSCYPILFLGANKGQQSNDLLFSTLLPVRKKDIVLARIFTILILQFTFMAIMSALYPLTSIIESNYIAERIAEKIAAGKTMEEIGPQTAGFGLESFAAVLGFGIIGFSVADIVFFPIYYKHGRSIVASTLCTILGFAAYLGIFTIALPLLSPAYMSFFKDNIWIQIGFLGVSLFISAGMHFLVYKIASKNLEKVDF
ncbi:MAG: hypothetical protein J5955_00615 [Bacilli bacterium]|nr:hypothetical protein [Bacilli bacterium]